MSLSGVFLYVADIMGEGIQTVSDTEVFMVYYRIALLRHVSACIQKPSSGESKTPKKNYHARHIKAFFPYTVEILTVQILSVKCTEIVGELFYDYSIMTSCCFSVPPYRKYRHNVHQI